MIEQVYQMTQNSNHTIEKVIADEIVHYNHMILAKSEGFLSIGLDEQEIHEYPMGTILKIPKGIKMNVKNLQDETLELIVVKAPAPGK
ncbi:MAG: hypothetical protein H2212_16370 [Ruminococcus sp.]|jgi:quercetin dioxygenase-like cupin family protein|nr:hypothetical protein [Ruminococcus sp.]